MKIRSERLADEAAIDALLASAFRDVAHSDHTEHAIVRALRRAGALTLSLVGEAEGGIVGYVAVSPVSVSDGATDWQGLGPLAVLPAWQRRGVGGALVRAALTALRADGAAGCVVLGDPDYYAGFGFAPCPGLVLPGVPAAYFQAQAFNAAVPRGTVAYHDAFLARA